MYSKYIRYNLIKIYSNYLAYSATKGKRVHNLFIFLIFLKLLKLF